LERSRETVDLRTGRVMCIMDGKESIRFMHGTTQLH
jgi:hypothetical protein